MCVEQCAFVFNRVLETALTLHRLNCRLRTSGVTVCSGHGVWEEESLGRLMFVSEQGFVGVADASSAMLLTLNISRSSI